MLGFDILLMLILKFPFVQIHSLLLFFPQIFTIHGKSIYSVTQTTCWFSPKPNVHMVVFLTCLSSNLSQINRVIVSPINLIIIKVFEVCLI